MQANKYKIHDFIDYIKECHQPCNIWDTNEGKILYLYKRAQVILLFNTSSVQHHK